MKSSYILKTPLQDPEPRLMHWSAPATECCETNIPLPVSVAQTAHPSSPLRLQGAGGTCQLGLKL